MVPLDWSPVLSGARGFSLFHQLPGADNFGEFLLPSASALARTSFSMLDASDRLQLGNQVDGDDLVSSR